MTARILLAPVTFSLLSAALLPVLAEEPAPSRAPVRVTIRDDKPVVSEPTLPVDPSGTLPSVIGVHVAPPSVVRNSPPLATPM